MKRMRVISVLVLSLILEPWAEAAAGGAPDIKPKQAAAAQNAALAEVVVTAQKTGAESIQKVPMAISAISGETLAEHGAINLTDVGRLIPNTELEPGPRAGYVNFTIRGIGVNGTVRSIDPAISLVQDGVPIDFPVLALLDTFDVASVEVLRGPQGILFGRNATGGVVAVRSALPRDQFEMRAEATGGNYGRADEDLSVGGPIAGGVLGKVSIIHHHNNGYFEDHNSGTFVPAPNNPSGQPPPAPVTSEVRTETWQVRPILVLHPTEAIDVTLIGEYSKIDNGGIAFQVAAPSPLLQQQFGYTPNLGKFDINNGLAGNLVPFTRGRTYRASGEVKVRTPIGTLTSITGYRDVHIREALDPDGIPFNFFVVEPQTHDRSDQVSEELRLLSPLTSTLQLLVGAYYDHLTINSWDARTISTLTPASPPEVSGYFHIQSIFHQRGDAAAGFANLQWTPLEGLNLEAGGRYSWEKKSIDAVPFVLCPTLSTCPTPFVALDKSWKNFSPRVIAAYQVDPALNVYVSWTNGFRSGQFDNRATTVANLGPVNPEKVHSVELGLKSSFFAHRLSFDFAAYREEYKDIQRTIEGENITERLANAASAIIRGFETEGSLNLAGLRLDAYVGFTDAYYTRFEGLDLTGDGIPDPQLARNLKFDRVPQWTAGTSATYRYRPGPCDCQLAGLAAYSYRSGYFLETTNNPAAHQNAFGTADASLTFSRSSWDIKLFVRNAFNAKYKEFVSLFPYGPAFSYGDPRTFGVTVGVSY